MALADALRALADEWPELSRTLPASEQRVVRQQLAAVVHGGDWDPSVLLSAALTDQSSEHPAWRALLERGTRRASGGADDPSVMVAAMRLRFAIELMGVSPTAVAPEAVERAAEERIFEAPMRDLRNERPHGVLALIQGVRRVAPTFQFDTDGNVRPAVVTVNEILRVDDDPWGSASWWLCPHASLHAIPADEIRLGDVERVIAAAIAADTGN
jgi:hypothetical protein